jgi:hypothetical protein
MASKKLVPEAGKLTNPRVRPAEVNQPLVDDTYRVDPRHPADRDGTDQQARKPPPGSAASARARKTARRAPRRAW